MKRGKFKSCFHRFHNKKGEKNFIEQGYMPWGSLDSDQFIVFFDKLEDGKK